jgi:glycosyltransferase involved in cell wall biosynthesis
LDGDPQLRQRMAEKGRERVTENFGWEHHIDRLIDSFEHLIETSSKSASAGK